ncbi:hypothetical protein [Pseudoxanthomonas indica]|nr:hypothetical protein [Pseudoxanthomonas indica]
MTMQSPVSEQLRSTRLRRRLLLWAGLASLVLPGMAWAADPAAVVADPAQTSAAAAPETTLPIPLPSQWTAMKERSVNLLGAPVGVARLETMRGGEDKHESVILVDGKVDNNTADHIISGSNTITDTAFDSANGINTIIQNTGTNVLIQNAMVVNVNFGGTPQ